MNLSEDQRLNLVISILAGYSYPIYSAWNLKEKLRSAGFADPAIALGRDDATIGNLLKSAGYDRGGITYIIAPRVRSLMEAIASGSLKGLDAAISSNQEANFCKLLLNVKGIGPKTAQIAWMLTQP
jgi:hypothetical protein